METIKYNFNGHDATVIIPDNPNGKWIWKTEFFYAFDASERALLDLGYTRVFYQISDKYGSVEAIRLMHNFHLDLIKRFNLEKKANLLGMSRGGLYAFNYAIFYPEYVNKVYLDAPVLDLKTWPPKESIEYYQLLEEYRLNADTYNAFKFSPIDRLDEYFSLGIPTLVVAGCEDEIVPFDKNSEIMIDYCKNKGIDLTYYLKPLCKHHPHSLDDVTPIIEFFEK